MNPVIGKSFQVWLGLWKKRLWLADGLIIRKQVFIFTDNATVETCSFKGSLSSQKLLSLIIRTKCGIRLHVFHVAGTRMIAQRTGGLSRGFLGQGVLSGEAMTVFIPIHQAAVDRSPLLTAWIQSWCGIDRLLLTCEDWFQKGHDIKDGAPEILIQLRDQSY